MTALHTITRPFRWVHQRTLARHGRQLDAMAAGGRDPQGATESDWLASQVTNNNRMTMGGGH